jgi:hypothetical protein
MKTYKDLLKESSLSRIQSQIKKYDSGIITAFRDREDCGKGPKIKRSEKMKRNAELKAELIKSGYGVTSVNGAWLENGEKEVKENSFFVVDLLDKGTLKRDLMRLGEKYEQDGVIFIKDGLVYLIGTNDCPDAYPGYGNVDKLGKSKFGKSGEFYTKIKGRPFVFE